MGLYYMARAGYDPEEAVLFWQRFSEFNQQGGGGAPPEFLSTHPVSAKRIKQLKESCPRPRPSSGSRGEPNRKC